MKLVIANAILYNSQESSYGRAATKLQVTVQPILRELDVLDDCESVTHRLHHELLSLLDRDAVRHMLKVHYPIPPKPPTPTSIEKHSESVGVLVDERQVGQIEAAVDIAARAEAAEKVAHGVSADSVLPSGSVPAGPTIGMTSGGVPEIQVVSSSEHDSAQARDIAHGVSKKRKRDQRDMDSAPGFRAPLRTRRSTNAEAAIFAESENAAAAQQANLSMNGDARDAVPPSSAQQISNTSESGRASAQRSVSPDKNPRSVSPDKHTPSQLKAMKREAELQKKRDDGARYRAAKKEQKLQEQKKADEAKHAAKQEIADRAKAEAEAEAMAEAAAAAETETAAARVRQRQHDTSASSSDGRNLNEWGLEVDRNDVSNHDSFLLFNSGWVLPEGTRRRRNGSSEQPLGASLRRKGMSRSRLDRQHSYRIYYR